MIHRTLAAAARHAQKLADTHGMRYTVVCAGSETYRIRLGGLPPREPFALTFNPRKG
jgi:hypothetical protein